MRPNSPATRSDSGPNGTSASTTGGSSGGSPSRAFRHELLPYADGPQGFAQGALEPVRSTLAQGGGVLVAVADAQAQALRDVLGGAEAEGVSFADIRQLAGNPARLLPALQNLAGEHGTAAGGVALAIVEPLWPGRGDAEVEECARHEELVNPALADEHGLTLVCAYDLDVASEWAIDAATTSHPLLTSPGGSLENAQFAAARPHPLAGSLPPAPAHAEELAFARSELAQVRRAVGAWASEEGLSREGVDDLVLAVDELAANSIRHGGGAGTLYSWREPGALVCEVRDTGTIEQPLVGRRRPEPDADSGRGVWLVNQLCDLVQLRSEPGQTVVRVHKRLPGTG